MTAAAASTPNMTLTPSFAQLRSPLSGKPLVGLVSCRRSDRSTGAHPLGEKNDPSAAGAGGFEPNLLSPPLSVCSIDTPPFKPTDSDQVSLSMKNRRRRRSRRHRAGLDRASTGDTEGQCIRQRYTRKSLTSTSVPDLRHDPTAQRIPSAAGQWLIRQQLQALHMAHRRDSIARSIGSRRRASLPQLPCRWTMPTKAASTRVLTESATPAATCIIIPSNDELHLSHPPSTQVLVKSRRSLLSSSHAENNHPLTNNASETPAMITLRRATMIGAAPVTRRTSLRPNAITSFPAPKFNRTTSTYLSSFFGLNPPLTPAKDADPIRTSVRQASWSTGQNSHSPVRKASITADRIQLTANTVAPPASTQVEFWSINPSDENRQELVTLPARRCSTTIISGSSIHEVIWDENITSSSEGSTSPEASGGTSAAAKEAESAGTGRKQSVLVEKLEAQLRDNERLGASSLDSKVSWTGRTLDDGHGRRKSRLQELTGWDLGSWYGADRPGQCSVCLDLKPQSNHDLSTSAEGLCTTLPGEEQVSPGAERVGFFPPLGGAAGNGQGPKVAPDPPTRPAAKRVSLEKAPSAVWAGAAPTRSAPPRNDEDKHSSGGSRRSSPPDRQCGSGIGIGQSSHMRRRSTHSHPQFHQPTRSPWSHPHKMSWPRVGKHDEHDEHDQSRPLLARRQRSTDDPRAAPHVLVDGQDVWSGPKARGTEPRKVCVQEFVQKIEGRSHGRPRSGPTIHQHHHHHLCHDLSGDDDHIGMGVLVARDGGSGGGGTCWSMRRKMMVELATERERARGRERGKRRGLK